MIFSWLIFTVCFLFVCYIYLFVYYYYYYCTGFTLWYPQKFLQYIIARFNPSVILLYPPFPHSCLIFLFSHINTHFHYVWPPSHFHCIFPLPLVHTPTHGLFFCTVLHMLGKKAFCLFNIAWHRISLYISKYTLISLIHSCPLYFSFLP
jgi:hypothetical protein